MRDLKSSKSGDAAKHKRTYTYARYMEFLNPTMARNTTEDSQDDGLVTANALNDRNNESIADEHLNSEHEEAGVACNDSTTFRRRKRRLEDRLDQYIAVVSKQAEQTMNPQANDDLDFFRSLIPDIQKLNNNNKLLF